MSSAKDSQSKIDRKQRETFRKRKKTLFKGSHLISKVCQCQVYLIICRKGKYYSYVTERNDFWPPTEEYLNQVYPSVQEVTAQEWAAKNVPELRKTEAGIKVKDEDGRDQILYEKPFPSDKPSDAMKVEEPTQNGKAEADIVEKNEDDPDQILHDKLLKAMKDDDSRDAPETKPPSNYTKHSERSGIRQRRAFVLRHPPRLRLGNKR